MNLFSLRRYFWLLPLLAAAPLAAQWGPPVISMHLKIGKEPDQLGSAVETPEGDYLGGVDHEGNIVITDPAKKRLQIYSASGTLIRSISPPESVKKTGDYWPEQPLVHPKKQRVLVKSGEHGYCVISYSGSVNRCFPDPRSNYADYQQFDRATEKGFVLRETTGHWKADENQLLRWTANLDECYNIGVDGAVSKKAGKCPQELVSVSQILRERRQYLSTLSNNAAERTAPEGWRYVLVKGSIAVGRCDPAESCTFAAFEMKNKPIATMKIPNREYVFDLDPKGDVYSIRHYRNSDVIIYKRAWTGPGAKKTTAIQSFPPRPMYYDREISFEDLDGRTLRELDLLRNTIYARAGNPFRKKWLRDYFASQPWYQPLEKMDEKRLSELDRKNARSIMEFSLDLHEFDLRDAAQGLQKKAKTGSLKPEEKIEVRLLSIRLGEWYGPENEKGEYQPNPLENPARLDQPITMEDLNDFSRRDLRLLRNTVYARRGKPFTSETLGGYFSDMEWYHPDPKYHDKRLNGVDKQNIATIISLERTLGGPMSEKEALGEQSLEGA